MNKIFDLRHFKGDLMGGITAGIVALLLVLTFGVSSEIESSAGLLMTLGIAVMAYKSLKAIPFMHRSEVIIMILVFVLSSVRNLVLSFYNYLIQNVKSCFKTVFLASEINEISEYSSQLES
jgi:NO-binding membrane sensor protein with MHYT domain